MCVCVYGNNSKKKKKKKKKKVLDFQILIATGLSVVISLTSTCSNRITALDFDPFGKHVYYDCYTNELVGVLTVVLGALVVFGLDSAVAYMYITRLIQTTRFARRSEEEEFTMTTKNGDDNNNNNNNDEKLKEREKEDNDIDSHKSKPHHSSLSEQRETKKDTTGADSFGVMTNDEQQQQQQQQNQLPPYTTKLEGNVSSISDQSSLKRTVEMFSHIRRATVIAVTSIVSRMITLTLVATIDTAYPLAQIDAFLNGLLICCAFQFGDGIYNILFCCFGAKSVVLRVFSVTSS
ncbi:hypothetical protein RFI_08631 [Reticulomyxa filosa]|uniref:Uncharacterized protein n=1 Tax=Reticulomyxa filosa TaxID=46433 RepID=X6NS09_RETFI|nr:hypothetical protein RFI_08631 [Reticulomyxa filosa]|eukprot:ETO28499.1 hypothetical protein RFI_08631 [Reticulomyxa filosa]